MLITLRSRSTPEGIYDWTVYKWLCAKVLGPLIVRDGKRCAIRISAWRDADSLWQARTSLVAIVKVADNRASYLLIEKSGHVLIRFEERVAKTAVGQFSREISMHNIVFIRRVSEELRIFAPRQFIQELNLL